MTDKRTSRNPAKRCKTCGKPCKANVRLCIDCWHARRAAKTTLSADCVPWHKKPKSRSLEGGADAHDVA